MEVFNWSNIYFCGKLTWALSVMWAEKDVKLGVELNCIPPNAYEVFVVTLISVT